jgi:sugar O-acyltransferase (sialic acid O-acetyltransferase NeuD family)
VTGIAAQVDAVGVTRRQALLLFPCNGNAIEALDCLGDEWECVGFVDDGAAKQGTLSYGIPVFDRQAFSQWPGAKVLAVPGSPLSFQRRRAAIDGLALEDTRFASVVHPSARISANARVGRNTLIMAGVVLTSNAVVGDHCCVLPNTVIHHDAVVGDWTLIGSNVTVAGGTIIGRNCYVGSGASLMNGLRIGEGALIGLGANVLRGVEAGGRVVGNPARPI